VRSTSLRIGIFGAEPWTEAMRREIEERMDLHAVDIYGLSEVIGPGVAQECVETKDGLHIREGHFYPEVVDPVTDAVLPDCESGEPVFPGEVKGAIADDRHCLLGEGGRSASSLCRPLHEVPRTPRSHT
jgi:phenylacetate-CoA ligase